MNLPFEVSSRSEFHTTIVIDLPPDKEKKLAVRAEDRGLDLRSYVTDLIYRDILAKPTLDDIFAPVRREFASSGMTDGDLDALIDEARDEVWQERRGVGRPLS